MWPIIKHLKSRINPNNLKKKIKQTQKFGKYIQVVKIKQ